MASSTYTSYSRKRKETEAEELERGGRDALMGPPGPSALIGVAFGLLAAGGFAGWEAALVGWCRLGLPDAMLSYELLALYLAVGALFGFIAGFPGLQGTRWLALWLGMWLGWLAIAPLSWLLTNQGLPGFLAVVAALPGALTLGWLSATLLPSGRALIGISAGLLVFVTAVIPANGHLLGSPIASVAWTVDGIALIVAIALGAIVAAVGGDGGTPRVAVLLVAYAASAWAIAVPRILDPDDGWPVATADGQPVVLIVVDALRADRVGAYGFAGDTTPAIDAQARRGLVYTDASSPAPWTLPALASILTGRLPGHHGAGINDGLQNYETALRSDVPTLARLLRDQGYVTAGVVTDRYASAAYGFRRGFDAYDDRPGPTVLPVAMAPLEALRLRPIPWPDYRDADALTDRAISFVQAQSGGKWFLMVHYRDVAGPLHPSEADLAALAASVEPGERAYAGAIHQVDRGIGRLLDAVPSSALVVITSTSGEIIGEERQHLPAMPVGVRHGNALFQEQIRVPLIVVGPGVPAERVHRPVSTVDIVPTVLDRLRLPPATELGGMPLVELTGGSAPPDRVINAEAVRYGPEQRMARIGAFKLVEDSGGWRLYDLGNDPLESAGLTGTVGLDQAWVSKLRAALPPLGMASRAPPSSGSDVADLLDRVGWNRPSPPVTQPP
jgi:arylsulfatase A-like enzyme